MTFAFQMDRLEASQPNAFQRWLACLRRALYILAIAYLIQLINWATNWPRAGWQEILRVDILNSMGLGLMVFSAAALLKDGRRVRAVLLAAVMIATVSPLVANLDWSGVPNIVKQYLMPGFERGHFPFFPCAAYVGFGMTAGAAVRLTDVSRLERAMQWSAIIGGTLILAGQYVSNLPYSVYPKSNFWTDNPILVLMRVGISLVLLAASFTWTAYAARPGWSWVQTLGKNSLMVYWVHLVLVYGAVTVPFQKALSIPETALATLVTIGLMVALSVVRQRWKDRRSILRAAASSQSPRGSTAPSPLPPG
jgi:hypothetical protein